MFEFCHVPWPVIIDHSTLGDPDVVSTFKRLIPVIGMTVSLSQKVK